MFTCTNNLATAHPSRTAPCTKWATNGEWRGTWNQRGGRQSVELSHSNLQWHYCKALVPRQLSYSPLSSIARIRYRYDLELVNTALDPVQVPSKFFVGNITVAKTLELHWSGLIWFITSGPYFLINGGLYCSREHIQMSPFEPTPPPSTQMQPRPKWGSLVHLDCVPAKPGVLW